jgi:hypothetical protein
MIVKFSVIVVYATRDSHKQFASYHKNVQCRHNNAVGKGGVRLYEAYEVK